MTETSKDQRFSSSVTTTYLRSLHESEETAGALVVDRPAEPVVGPRAGTRRVPGASEDALARPRPRKAPQVRAGR